MLAPMLFLVVQIVEDGVNGLALLPDAMNVIPGIFLVELQMVIEEALCGEAMLQEAA